tara:strand:- start:563 stop:865 length:303 start_codon:yes stop_codon:yes gene_type:complete
MYVVAYVKIVDNKRDGIKMQGVYFGGVGDTLEAAEEIAKKCVNEVRGGTVIPKVFPLENKLRVVETMHDAEHKFDQIAESMMQAEEILGKQTNKRRRRKK